jgi:hypothetical protein
MKFIKRVEELDKVIVEYGTRMLSKHINQGQNNLVPLNTYNNTIFNSMQISGYATQYKIFNNVAIWLLDNISDEIYLESINDYLRSNTTEHGKNVYNSYINNIDYFQDVYFGEERRKVVNNQGILFVLTEKTKENIIVKVCYFKEVEF